MPRRSHRKPDRRRALELHDGCGDAGCPEGLIIAHGFTIPDMVELMRAGLATATGERVVAGGRSMEVARVKITAAGARRWRTRSDEVSGPLTVKGCG